MLLPDRHPAPAAFDHRFVFGRQRVEPGPRAPRRRGQSEPGAIDLTEYVALEAIHADDIAPSRTARRGDRLPDAGPPYDRETARVTVRQRPRRHRQITRVDRPKPHAGIDPRCACSAFHTAASVGRPRVTW